jgi:N-methylhydantoinase B
VSDVDPITLEVVRNATVAVAEEMNANLVRTGYSPNIKERRDCSTALFGSDGEMVCQAETIPVHLGAMPFSVAAALERFPPERLEPGDAVLVNDPFRGGAHLPDLTLVSPVFWDGELVAFAANRAHHADVGGARAGSVAADSTEIYQEGLRIPPVKFARGTSIDDDGDGDAGDVGAGEDAGEGSREEPDDLVASEVDEDLLSVLLANVRTPDERRGDLRAQLAANETGRRRFRELAATHGDDLAPALEAVKDYSERRMRAEIEALPDGVYEFRDVLDDDGRGNGPLPVAAAVAIEGDEVRVDFAGTAAQTDGPVNAVFAVTASATYYAVRCVTDPEIPPNAGCYRPIDIDAPERTIVNAAPPAAVVGGNLETSQRVTDVVLGAFAGADPGRSVAAGQGTMNNVTFGGTDPRDGRPYAFYETQGGGFGGRASADGMDGVHVHMSNTLNTPAEVLETAYPLRVRRYALRPDSGGAGTYRGGLGLRRDIEVRDHVATFSLLADRYRHRPYGLAGGEPGASGTAVLFGGSAAASEGGAGAGAGAGLGDGDGGVGDDGEAEPNDGAGERLPPKTTRELAPGTVVSLRTPGGGGYGDPADRDPAAIERDLLFGKLTPAAARARYGYEPDGDDGPADGTHAVSAGDGESPTGADGDR